MLQEFIGLAANVSLHLMGRVVKMQIASDVGTVIARNSKSMENTFPSLQQS